jgi:hypothetical protein
MDLIIPDISLIIWNFLSIVNLILCIIAIIKLANNHSIVYCKKIAFLFAIIFLPFIGVLIYMAYHKKTKQQRA